jgi:hypothetical protein
VLVSHRHKLVIFTLERTASKSIHHTLKPFFDVCIDVPPYKHCTADTFKHLVEPFLSEKYYKCAVVREPISRCISLYNCVQSKAKDYTSFSDWWSTFYHEYRPSWLIQKDLLSVDDCLYVDRLFDFKKLNLLSNFINTHIEFEKLNHAKNVAVIKNEVMQQMQTKLKDDIIFYKSIVDAGGELIINPYHPTP